MIKYILKVFTSFTLLVSVSLAQELREITFHVYGQSSTLEINYLPVGALALETGVPAQPDVALSFHSRTKLGPYKYIGGSFIEFKDLDSSKIVGRVNIPKIADEWLLIFVYNPRHRANPENQLKYLIYPFNDTKSHLPEGSLVFLNISGKVLDGFVEGRRTKIPLGESDALPVQESFPINLFAPNFNQSKILPAVTKTYKFESGHRYLMILFPPILRGSSNLDVRLLAELVNES